MLFGMVDCVQRSEEFVRRVGLEPTRPKTPAPKAGASASSATGALVTTYRSNVSSIQLAGVRAPMPSAFTAN